MTDKQIKKINKLKVSTKPTKRKSKIITRTVKVKETVKKHPKKTVAIILGIVTFILGIFFKKKSQKKEITEVEEMEKEIE